MLKGESSYSRESPDASISDRERLIVHLHSQSRVDEVFEVLKVWRLLEDSYCRLSEEEKSLVRSETPLSNGLAFRGFETHSEASYLSIADFIINKMDLFTEFRNRDLRSPEPLLAKYRQVLQEFYSVFPDHNLPKLLDATRIVAIARASAEAREP
ncbi:MAG: YfbU family protein [Gemmatimonadaceae bacterium]|nr:YfbU family protein [Gemmatimonadaceae bacterium]